MFLMSGTFYESHVTMSGMILPQQNSNTTCKQPPYLNYLLQLKFSWKSKLILSVVIGVASKQPVSGLEVSPEN